MAIKDKMMDKTAINEFHRIMATPQSEAWGIQVSATGRRVIPAHQEYFHNHETQYPWSRKRQTQGRKLPEYGMVYLTRGQGYFSSQNAAEIPAKAGDLLFLFPNVWHLYHPRDEIGWDEHWVTFSGSIIENLVLNGVLRLDRPVLNPGLDERLREMFCEMADLACDRPQGFEGCLASSVMTIISRALCLSSAVQGTAHRISPIVEKAMAYMETHYDKPLNISHLAGQFHMSYRHFCRVFKSAAGLPPQQYFNRVRIHHAKELLARGDQTINQIAQTLGFCDAYHFSRLFKKLTGWPPSAWREIGWDV